MSNRNRIWRRIRTIWATVGAFVLLGLGTWSFFAFQASNKARAALVSDEHIQVVRGDDHWLFSARPEERKKTIGLLFFPGALVEPAAYAPLARAIAREGYPVLLVELPRRGAFGFAFGSADDAIGRARAAMQAVPDVARWVVAGHSRGGAVAAHLVRGRGAMVGGLVLVGTSHPRDFSLSDVTVPVAKILGAQDCIAEIEKSERNRHLLPATTRWMIVEGGSHSQFGWYGLQPGDCSASISRARQQEQTMAVILETLQEAEPGSPLSPSVSK